MRQLTFWDMPSLDPTDRVKSAMREALKACSLSREQVVDEMNRLAKREGMTTNGNAQGVSEAILDKWVSSAAAQHRIPLHYLPLFCTVTKSILPLKALAAPLQVQIISGEDHRMLAWAKAEVERKQAAKRAKRLSLDLEL